MTENRIKFQNGLLELQQAFDAQFPESPKREPTSRIMALVNVVKLKRRTKVLREMLKLIHSWGPDIEERLDFPDGPRAEELLDAQWKILNKVGVKRAPLG